MSKLVQCLPRSAGALAILTCPLGAFIACTQDGLRETTTPDEPSRAEQSTESSSFVQGVCGQTITESVTLTEDIGPCSDDGIIIGADGVTLEGDGHVVSGDGTGTGVFSVFEKVTITHLFVHDFETGIWLYSGENTAVTENQIRDSGVGVMIQSNDEAPPEDNLLELNVIADNTLGIYVDWPGNSIYHNLIWNNDTQIDAVGGNLWTDEGEGLGNIWSDYWGEDLDGDGVGDTNLPHEAVDNAPILTPSLTQLFGNGGFLCDDWWMASMWLVWRGGWSPAELGITDPFGRRLSATLNEMPRIGFYAEDETVEPGTKKVQAMILTCAKHDPGNGIYSFEMTALDDLTYDMEWFASHQEDSFLYRYVVDMPLAAGRVRSVDLDLQQEVDPVTGEFLGAVVKDASDPADQIAVLINNIEQLAAKDRLNRGESSSLAKKLEAALTALERDRENAALGQLSAFINEVEALVTSGRLTEDEGQHLIEQARSVITHIENS